MPDDIEKFPWGGHLGTKLLDKVLPIIHKSKTTLIFTNTRSQCEVWYQQLLNKDPDLAGLLEGGGEQLLCFAQVDEADRESDEGDKEENKSECVGGHGTDPL